MASKATQRKYAILYSWVKWTPLLALIFALFGVDAWLNIEKYHNDYLLWELSKTVDIRAEALQALRVQSEYITDQGWVEDKVAALEMVSLVPGQSRVIRYTERPSPNQSVRLPHTLAHWDAERMSIRREDNPPPLTIARVAPPLVENAAAPSPIEQITTTVETLAPVVPEQEEIATEVEVAPDMETEIVVIEPVATPEPEAVEPVEIPSPVPVLTPAEAPTPEPVVIAVLDPTPPAAPMEPLEPLEPSEVALEILEPSAEASGNIDESLDALLSPL